MGGDKKIRAYEASRESELGVVVFSVSFYIVTAIAMILVNKAVLNTVDLPLLFLLLQMVIAVIIMRVGHKLGVFHCPKIERITCRRLIPMVSANVVGLSLNTLCLQYVDAGFYQVARSLILPFTLFQNWLFLGQRSSIPVLVCCSIIFSGFLIGTLMDHKGVESVVTTTTTDADVDPLALAGDLAVAAIAEMDLPLPTPETHRQNLGILFGVLSSITTSFHAVVIKSSVDAVRGSTLALVYYNNVLSTFAMVPVVYYTGEFGKLMSMARTAWPAMVRSFRWSSPILAVAAMEDQARREAFRAQQVLGEVGPSSPSWSFARAQREDDAFRAAKFFIVGALATGIVGFLINIAGFLQIKVTSPVSHMISSAVRGVLQTMLAVAILGESTSLPRNVGIVLILFGSCAYTWVKAREARVDNELLDPKTGKMEKP